MTLRLDTPIQFLKGVGPHRAAAFAKLGVVSAEDLLYHIPHRYLDATTVTPAALATVGMDVTVVGKIVSTGVIPTRRRLRIFRAILKDDSGLIECAWPGQAFLERTIREGQMLLVSGPVKYFHGRQLAPREHVVLADKDDDELDANQGVILPVYSATEGLSHRQIRWVIHAHLEQLLALAGDVDVPMPPQLKLPRLQTALEAVHRPTELQQAEQGRRRLAFDELLDLQLVVARARHVARTSQKGMRHVVQKQYTSQLKGGLPFDLTGDQRRCIREITNDMASDRRMHRLLMGDVGAGKTIVALFAMLLAVENECQAVFMAPTEVLADQHARTLGRLLAPLGIVPDVLLGRFSAGEKEAIRERFRTGASRVIVGTHALAQEKTAFWRLGLVVIDEQHRFGVEQRAALIEKGEGPDVLLLTATPIPRTLALTLYGDLDISVLREKPAGRSPVRTSIRGGKDRAKIYQFIEEQCGAGHQAYVIYPVIEESEKVDLKAATVMATQIQEAIQPLVVGLVHGRLKAEERESVMEGFRAGKVDVLVATTVIEVGIDVPNATVMLIEHPERFGLAQLHQLRGRVGRGEAQSHCILIADAGARERLKAFASTDDGFKIAELDLQHRGMGQLAGTQQSGGIPLRFTDLTADADLVGFTRDHARQIIEEDPEMTAPRHTLLRKRIERKHERGITLFRVG